jgi:hypothetical protein
VQLVFQDQNGVLTSAEQIELYKCEMMAILMRGAKLKARKLLAQ